MKKSVLFLLFLSIFILSGIFVSVFLPKINIEITIKPQYQSVVNAHESEQEKPRCVVLSSSDLNPKKIIEGINKSYDKGYSLKGFSTSSGQYSFTHFAVVCKE